MESQKRESIKRPELSKNLIIDFIISLFLLKLKSSDPYMYGWIFLLQENIPKAFHKFFEVGFKSQILLKSSILRLK